MGFNVPIANVNSFVNCSVVAVHFWAPTFKWGINIANIVDFTKPLEKLSYPQQIGINMNAHAFIYYHDVHMLKKINK